MIKIAIVEDDERYVEQLQTYIARYQEGNEVAIETMVFEDGLHLVQQYQPVYDIIFFDIEMPHMDGMTAAEKIREMDADVLIMFITNMAQYAIKGYAVNAIDYVLKPINYYAFSMKMKRLLRILGEREKRYVVIQGASVVKRLVAQEIYYVEVDNHQLVYHTKDGDYSVTGSLRAVEAAVAGEPFVRCNSCYLVNLAHVDGVKQDCAIVQDCHLKISRPKRKEFLEALLNYHRGWK